jgi:hypothetical protein
MLSVHNIRKLTLRKSPVENLFKLYTAFISKAFDTYCRSHLTTFFSHLKVIGECIG